MLYKLTKESTPRFPRTILFQPKTDGNEKTIDTRIERYSAATAKIHQIQAKSETPDDSEGDNEEDVRNGNLLMVDQLWLWAIDTSKLPSIF